MVTEIVKEENPVSGSVPAAYSNVRPASNPAWLERLRESAMDRFEELGFPSVKDEEWKYTNVAPIAKLDFNPALASVDAERPGDFG